MRLLAYKGVSIVSRAIRFQTRSEYSHIALESMGDVIEADAKQGVVVYAHGFRKNHTKGTVVDVYDVHELDSWAAWEYANSTVGKPYDYRGVLRFLSRKDFFDNGKLFCSELAQMACVAGGVHLIDVPPWEVTPRDVVASPMTYRVDQWTV